MLGGPQLKVAAAGGSKGALGQRSVNVPSDGDALASSPRGVASDL